MPERNLEDTDAEEEWIECQGCEYEDFANIQACEACFADAGV